MSFLRRLFVGMEMDCAWCRRVMQRRGLFGPAAVSHGICDDCVAVLEHARSGLEVPRA